jgi:hypothetical protein
LLYIAFTILCWLNSPLYCYKEANIPKNVNHKSPCVGNDEDESNLVALYMGSNILANS